MDLSIRTERDLRSALRDHKRSKDASSKWANGVRPSPGCGFDWATDAVTGGSESQQARKRPQRKYSEMGTGRKPIPNVNKMRARWEIPQGRFRSILHAWGEIGDQDSIENVPYLPASPRPRTDLHVSDHIMYSFDWADGPNQPQALEDFVKMKGGETDRILREEYEILDGNGESLVGQKARQSLRRSQTGRQGTHTEEVDGFELV